MSSSGEDPGRSERFDAFTFTNARRPPSSGAAARSAATLFLFFLAFYLLTTGGSLTTTDAVITFDLTKNLVERHSIALSDDIIGHGRNRGADGRFYSQHGIGVSLYGVPFFCAGRIVEKYLGERVRKADLLAKAFVDTGSAVAAAGAVAVFYLFAWHVTRNARAASFAAGCLGWGTALWPYSKFGFNQPLATLLLVSAVFLAWSALRYGEDRKLLWSGFLIGAGWLTRHEMALAVIPVALWVAALSRDDPVLLLRRSLLLLPGTLLAGVFWGYYNSLRFDHWSASGYAPTFGLEGYAGLLLSPGASVFLYSPIVWVGIVGWRQLARHQPQTAWLAGGEIALLFGFYGAMDDWFGGRSYGARYLVPLLPFACLPLAVLVASRRTLIRGSILLAAVTLSILVQLPGVLVDYAKVQESYVQNHPGVGVRARVHSWNPSPLALNEKAAVGSIARDASLLWTGDLPPESASGHDPRTAMKDSLDFWWLYLHWLRLVPPWLLIASIALLIAFASASGLLFLRTVRQLDAGPTVVSA